MDTKHPLTKEVEFLIDEDGTPLLHSLGTGAPIAFSGLSAVVDLARTLTELLVSVGVMGEDADADAADEVCTWSEVSDRFGTFYQTTCKRFISITVASDHPEKAFYFCPYCGRKIEVVNA